MPTLNISGYLKDSSGNGIPNKNINIYITPSGSQFPSTPNLTLTTQSDGSFSGSINVDPGIYDVKARFEGDEVYLPSEDQVSVDARISTTLTLNVSVS